MDGFYNKWWYYPEDELNHRAYYDGPDNFHELTFCGKTYKMSEDTEEDFDPPKPRCKECERVELLKELAE